MAEYVNPRWPEDDGRTLMAHLRKRERIIGEYQAYYDGYVQGATAAECGELLMAPATAAIAGNSGNRATELTIDEMAEALADILEYCESIGNPASTMTVRAWARWRHRQDGL